MGRAPWQRRQRQECARCARARAARGSASVWASRMRRRAGHWQAGPLAGRACGQAALAVRQDTHSMAFDGFSGSSYKPTSTATATEGGQAARARSAGTVGTVGRRGLRAVVPARQQRERAEALRARARTLGERIDHTRLREVRPELLLLGIRCLRAPTQQGHGWASASLGTPLPPVPADAPPSQRRRRARSLMGAPNSPTPPSLSRCAGCGLTCSWLRAASAMNMDATAASVCGPMHRHVIFSALEPNGLPQCVWAAQSHNQQRTT